MMVAALWSNPNWDDDKRTRANAIEKIESQYEEAAYKIQNVGREEEGEEIDKENPFFAASERGLEKLFGKYEGKLPPATDSKEAAEWAKDIDQS